MNNILKNENSKQKRIKSPTKCERKSCELFDNDLVASN